jgi:phosphoribosyl 1,2-cyclic phosphodiesterase
VVCGGVKVTQLTDVGHLPDAICNSLAGSHVLILESNHDLEMLRVGPYPWTLKQRLVGRFGHLSNTAVGRFIRDRYDGHAEYLVLAHLSSKNNHPELARQEAVRALGHRGLGAAGVQVSYQHRPTEPIRL